MSVTQATVNSCSVADCAFNSDSACRALAITIDDPSPATCATYKASAEKGGANTQVTNVGACKASSCSHNKDLMCTASSVKIGVQDGKISCLTYSAS